MMQKPHDKRRQKLFTVRFYCMVVVTAVCLSWSSAEAQDYRYPFHDPYLATATCAILNSDDLTPRLKRQVVHVPGLPGRNQLPSLDDQYRVAWLD